MGCRSSSLLAALTYVVGCGFGFGFGCSFQPAGGSDVVVDAAGDGANGDGGSNVADAGDGDLDDDGVADTSDNCPRVPNPAPQRDHDADGAGDPCDPCPHRPLADGSGDVDGDGVGDPCDPNPGARDRIVLFDGFYEAPSAEWTYVGTWDHDASGTGFMRYPNAVAAAAFAVYPRQFDPPFQIESAVVVDALTSASAQPSRQAGVVFGGSAQLDAFYLCSVRDDVNSTPARAYLGRFASIDQVAENASTNLADDLAAGSTFRIRGSHSESGQSCLGTLVATTGNPALAATLLPGKQIALRTFGLAARFDYLVVYQAAP